MTSLFAEDLGHYPRVAIERDEPLIRNWIRTEWPRVKKKPGA